MSPPPWKLDAERIAETVQSAPSIFNSKPWLPDPLLRPVAENRIELHAKGGWLRTDDGVYFDPLARELAISCGAALFNLRLAIRVAGHELSVWLLPDRKPVSRRPAPASTLLASVEIVTTRISPPTTAEQELYEAVWRRHTNRWPYRIVPAPLPLIQAMEGAAAKEGATLRVAVEPQLEAERTAKPQVVPDVAVQLAHRPPPPGQGCATVRSRSMSTRAYSAVEEIER